MANEGTTARLRRGYGGGTVLWRHERAVGQGRFSALPPFFAFGTWPERGCPQPQQQRPRDTAQLSGDPPPCGRAAAGDSRAPVAMPRCARWPTISNSGIHANRGLTIRPCPRPQHFVRNIVGARFGGIGAGGMEIGARGRRPCTGATERATRVAPDRVRRRSGGGPRRVA